MNWLTKSVLPKIKALVSSKDSKENLWESCFYRNDWRKWNKDEFCE